MGKDRLHSFPSISQAFEW